LIHFYKRNIVLESKPLSFEKGRAVKTSPRPLTETP